MVVKVSWHGTQQESFDLVNAIARNCTCELGLMGVRLATCGSHRMLMLDQRARNGLLFWRRVPPLIAATAATLLAGGYAMAQDLSTQPVVKCA